MIQICWSQMNESDSDGIFFEANKGCNTNDQGSRSQRWWADAKAPKVLNSILPPLLVLLLHVIAMMVVATQLHRTMRCQVPMPMAHSQ